MKVMKQQNLYTPLTEKEIRDKAKNSDKFVRGSAVLHLNCPDDVFMMLAEDREQAVRVMVAGSPHSPVEAILKALEVGGDAERTAYNTNGKGKQKVRSQLVEEAGNDGVKPEDLPEEWWEAFGA